MQYEPVFMLCYQKHFKEITMSIKKKLTKIAQFYLGMTTFIILITGCSGGGSSSSTAASSTTTGVTTPSKVSVVNTN
jgi:phage-related minor tail protein